MHAEIARVLKSRNFSFVIKIAGDGPYREKLEEMIEEYEIQENLILLGKQNELKAYYEEADIFIHPADLEGFGIVVPEAMSSGLPVILSNKGALPELVNNMEDGIIVDAYNPDEWADAIINLYNDRGLYEKLSKNGNETYKARFTPEIYAKNLDLIYLK
jgi:glycosyltransferase involved in cell wall biosynthesis